MCLIGRTLEKLERVEKEVRSLNPSIHTIKICVNFSQNANTNFYESEVLRPLEAIPRDKVALLILNAGCMPNGNFERVSAQDLQDILDVNLYQVGMLSRMLLGNLFQRALTGRHAALITVSSLFGKFC